MQQNQQRLGGPSNEKNPTPEIQEIADKLKGEVESKLHKTFSTFQVVKYIEQVIAGMQYLLKIKVGDNEYVHIHAIRAPKEGADAVLKDVEGNQKENDPLYFDKVTSPKGVKKENLSFATTS